MALQGLIPLIEDRDFANLPLIFTFLTSFFEKIDAAIQLDLQIVLEKLAKRSEVETIYLLKTNDCIITRILPLGASCGSLSDCFPPMRRNPCVPR